MDSLDTTQNIPQSTVQSTPESTQKKSNRAKKAIIFSILALLLGAGAYSLYTFYWKPDNFLRQIYLVPADAMFIVETDSPVKNWKKFSESAPWQYLSQQETMSEINEMAQELDSLLRANATLMELLGKRNLLISAHPTRRNDYDFLFVVDLQKASKMETLKEQFENLFKSLNYTVTARAFEGSKIMELFDPANRSTLYLTFVDNHVVCSFTGALVEKSIKEKEQPHIGRDFYFQEIEQKMSGSALFRIYVNFNYFNYYLTSLMGTPDADLKALCESMEYTGLQLNVSDKQMSFKGYSNLKDSSDSYMAALLQSGANEITAQKILSNRTAFFAVMGFADANDFMDNVENVLQNNNDSYQSYKKTWDKISNYLKIDIRKNFLGWMDGEVVFAQNTPGSLGRQNEFVAVVKMKDAKEAVANLNFIEECIRKKTPVKFKTIEYEGYSIRYLHIGGFFRLLFGRMFEKLDKPYYTIIDDYVVFSNSTATLLSMIEDFRTGQTLENETEFDTFIDEFNSQASLFVYANSQKSFPLLKNLVSAPMWQSVQENRNFIVCFPQIGFQLTADNMVFDTRMVTEFQKPNLEENVLTDEEFDEEEFSVNEDTLSTLQLFYAEKMTGNVHTEFYDEGTIKSQTEMKNGVRNGIYKEFYPSGKLKVYGRFKNNKKNKTWYFYGEDEVLLKKNKWKDGKAV